MRFRLWTFALLFSAACSSSGSGSGAPASGSGAPASGSGAPASSEADDKAQEEPNVKLVQPGSAPLSKLRYRIDEGAAETFVLVQSRTEAMVGQKERTVPTTKLTLALAPKGKNTAGDREWSYEVKDSAVVADSQSPHGISAELEQAVKKLIGLKGTFVATDRGHLRKVEPAPYVGTDAALKQAGKGLADSLSLAFVPLPAAAVGAGARWEHTFESPQMGITVKTVARYEVVSISGEDVKLKVSTSQEAGKQAMDPGDGSKIEVSGYKSDGTGEITLSTRHLTPRANKTEMKGSMTLEGLGKAAKEIKLTTLVDISGK